MWLLGYPGVSLGRLVKPGIWFKVSRCSNSKRQQEVIHEARMKFVARLDSN